MILAIVKQQLRQIRNISRFRFAIAGLLSIITKYKNNLKSRAHKECMAKIGRYVERALDRLTVTTMLLCSDSAPKILAGRPASAGLPFLLRCAVLRCVMSCDVPNHVAMWISVDDTPRVWITHILRPQVPFRLESMCGFVFQSAV